MSTGGKVNLVLATVRDMHPQDAKHAWQTNKSPRDVVVPRASLLKKSGDTYFRTFGTIIGSESLTAVFGMGTGVTFQI